MEEPPETVQRCLLFADIADSTKVYREQGDQAGRRAITTCLTTLERAAVERGGRVVDRIGDEVFCVFETASQAASAAVRMQEYVDDAVRAGRLPEVISIRIGFHWGPVIVQGDKVFGDAVHSAKRASSLAKTEQIVTTAETVNELDLVWQDRCHPLGAVTVKGKRGVFEVFELVWRKTLATMDYTPGEAARPRHDRLVLECGGKTFTVGGDLPTLSIGRGRRACDLTIGDHGISRLHAVIEHRGDRFVLTDMSRNGTIVMQGGRDVHLRGEELRLVGRRQHSREPVGRRCSQISIGVSPGVKHRTPPADEVIAPMWAASPERKTGPVRLSSRCKPKVLVHRKGVSGCQPPSDRIVPLPLAPCTWPLS